MVDRSTRAVEQVAHLTAKADALLSNLEKVLALAGDTTRISGKLLRDREIYERTLVLTQALKDLLKLGKSEGLTDVIHFWRNVKVRKHSQKTP